MAEKLNLGILAEGVETREQVELLRKIGCDYVQGYYYAKPMPEEEFFELLAAQKKEEENNGKDNKRNCDGAFTQI